MSIGTAIHEECGKKMTFAILLCCVESNRTRWGSKYIPQTSVRYSFVGLVSFTFLLLVDPSMVESLMF